jgi:uncharacterized protein
MGGHLKALVAIGGIDGNVEALERALGEVGDAQAIAVVGDLTAPWSEPSTYRAIFKALGRTGAPAFWVPGRNDAPLREYLREAYNMELVYESLRGVHGTAAVGPGDVVFAGLGGEIVDDPDAIRGEEAVLRYPGWEAEYRLKIAQDLGEHARVFLFTTPPAHKGLKEPGSETLAELIKTYVPRVAVIGGDEPREERLGTTLVISPGRVAHGSYAVVDVDRLEVEQRTVSERAAV